MKIEKIFLNQVFFFAHQRRILLKWFSVQFLCLPAIEKNILIFIDKGEFIILQMNLCVNWMASNELSTSMSRKSFYEHEELVKSNQMASKKLSNSSDGKVRDVLKWQYNSFCMKLHIFLRSEREPSDWTFRHIFLYTFSSYFFLPQKIEWVFRVSGEKATHWYALSHSLVRFWHFSAIMFSGQRIMKFLNYPREKEKLRRLKCVLVGVMAKEKYIYFLREPISECHFISNCGRERKNPIRIFPDHIIAKGSYIYFNFRQHFEIINYFIFLRWSPDWLLRKRRTYIFFPSNTLNFYEATHGRSYRQPHTHIIL